MRILFDFECLRCASTFEEFNESSAEVPYIPPTCPGCESNADVHKLIGAVTIDPKMGLDPDYFPTMGDKWAKMREARYKHEFKQARDHGDHGYETSGRETFGE